MADQLQSYDQQIGMVSTSGGRYFPSAAFDPSQLQSLPVTSQVSTPPVTVSSPMPHAGDTSRTKQLLSGLQLVQSTVQSGAPKGTVDAAMAPAAKAEDAYAQQVAGDANALADKQQASIAEQRATAEQAKAKADADEAMHRQRQEIARLNQGAIAAQEDPDVDPRRLIDSMSTGTKILTILLSALGGAAGAVTGTENGAMKEINRAIDADIMAQQESIKNGQARRGNLIEYFQRQGMDETSAADAAHAVALANIERLNQLEAQELGSEGARNAANQLGAQMKAARESLNGGLKLKIETGQTSKTYQRPQPVGGSVTASDVLKETLAGRDLGQLQRSGLTQQEYSTQATKYSEQSAKNDDITRSTVDVVEALGGSVDVIRDDKGNAIKYRITGSLDQPRLGGDATRYETAIAKLKQGDVMGMAREPSKELQNEFAEITTLPFLDTQKKVKLQQLLDMAVRGRREISGGYSEHVVSDVDKRKGSGAGSGISSDPRLKELP